MKRFSSTVGVLLLAGCVLGAAPAYASHSFISTHTWSGDYFQGTASGSHGDSAASVSFLPSGMGDKDQVVCTVNAEAFPACGFCSSAVTDGWAGQEGKQAFECVADSGGAAGIGFTVTVFSNLHGQGAVTCACVDNNEADWSGYVQAGYSFMNSGGTTTTEYLINDDAAFDLPACGPCACVEVPSGGLGNRQYENLTLTPSMGVYTGFVIAESDINTVFRDFCNTAEIDPYATADGSVSVTLQ